MKVFRWLAIAVTALMSLMNLGVALGGGDEDVSAIAVTAGAVLFVAGLAAAVGLAIRVPWGRPAVIAVGALNLIGGVVALTTESEGAVIGIGVSVLILLFGFLAADRNEARLPASPRSLG